MHVIHSCQFQSDQRQEQRDTGSLNGKKRHTQSSPLITIPVITNAWLLRTNIFIMFYGCVFQNERVVAPNSFRANAEYGCGMIKAAWIVRYNQIPRHTKEQLAPVPGPELRWMNKWTDGRAEMKQKIQEGYLGKNIQFATLNVVKGDTKT